MMAKKTMLSATTPLGGSPDSSYLSFAMLRSSDVVGMLIFSASDILAGGNDKVLFWPTTWSLSLHD